MLNKGYYTPLSFYMGRVKTGQGGESKGEKIQRGRWNTSEDEEVDDSDKQGEKIILDGGVTVNALTQFHRLVNRGKHLKYL